MRAAPIYLLLALVVAVSCSLEYWLSRWLAHPGSLKRKWGALPAVASCALALAVLRSGLAATDSFVLFAALFAGVLLSRQIRSPGALVTMLIVAAIVDVISTHVGPTRWIVGQAQHSHGVPLIQWLAVCLRINGRLVPVIGVGDLMFFTACVSAMRRFGWPELYVLVVPLAALLSALAVGLAAGLTAGIPFLTLAVGLYAYARPSPERSLCHG